MIMELTNDQIDAELLQILKANSTMPKKSLYKLIKKHFGGLSKKQIAESIDRLMR
jgi:hypothetical protein